MIEFVIGCALAGALFIQKPGGLGPIVVLLVLVWFAPFREAPQLEVSLEVGVLFFLYALLSQTRSNKNGPTRVGLKMVPGEASDALERPSVLHIRRQELLGVLSAIADKADAPGGQITR